MQNQLWTKLSVTVHSSSFHVPDRFPTSQGMQYSTNTDFMRQNRTLRQMNDPLLLKCMCCCSKAYTPVFLGNLNGFLEINTHITLALIISDKV